MWNRFDPQRSCPALQHLRRVALPRVLVAVEAHQAPHEKDRQADIGIDSEQELIEVGHRSAPLSRLAWAGRELHHGGLGPRDAAPGRARGTENHRLVDPLVVDRLFLHHRLVPAGAPRDPALPPWPARRRRWRCSRWRGPAALRRRRAGCARNRRACPSLRPRAVAPGIRAPPAGNRGARCRPARTRCGHRSPSGPPSPGRARASRRGRARRDAATSLRPRSNSAT